MTTASRCLEDRDAYTVGWIAALPIERAAAIAILDEQHSQPHGFIQPFSDSNSYTWDRIGRHNVVIASLSAGVYGTTSASTTASQMLSPLPRIRFGLLVGIGAGIPGLGYDIRLGDVAVSQPDARSGGVIQYDLGKVQTGTKRKRERRGFLNAPPELLLKALARLRAQYELQASTIPELLNDARNRNPRLHEGYTYQGAENDRLFKSSYNHTQYEGEDCQFCDQSEEIWRLDRETNDPVIHFGVIASGNMVIKNASVRDCMIEELKEDAHCIVLRWKRLV